MYALEGEYRVPHEGLLFLNVSFSTSGVISPGSPPVGGGEWTPRCSTIPLGYVAILGLQAKMGVEGVETESEPDVACDRQTKVVMGLLTKLEEEGAMTRVCEVDFTSSTQEPVLNFAHIRYHSDLSIATLLRGIVLGNPSLERLIFTEALLQPGSQAFVALLECLSHPECRLVHLDISGNRIGSPELVRIAEAITANSHLRLTLRSLYVNRCGRSYRRLLRSEEMEDGMPTFPSDEGFDSASLEAFALCIGSGSYLEEFSCSRFSHNGAVSLESIETLAEALRGNVRLRKLNFVYMSLTTEGMVILSEALRLNPSLVEIDFSLNLDVGIRGWTELFHSLVERGVPLERLNLHSTSSSLSGFNSFTEVEPLTPEETESAGNALFQMVVSPYCPRVFDLGENKKIPVLVFEAFGRAIRHPDSKRLEELDLSYLHMSDESLLCLGRAMQENQHITSISLGTLRMSSEDTTPVREFMDCIARNTTLQSFGITIVHPNQTVHSEENDRIAEEFLADRYPMDHLKVCASRHLGARVREKTQIKLELRRRMKHALLDSISTWTMMQVLQTLP